MCQAPAMMLTSDIQLPGSWPKAGGVEGVRLNPCGPWAKEVRVGEHPHSPQLGRAARNVPSQATGPPAPPQGLQPDPHQLCYSLDHVISGKPCLFLVSASLSVKWAQSCPTCLTEPSGEAQFRNLHRNRGRSGGGSLSPGVRQVCIEF